MNNNTVTINEKEYDVEAMSDKQKLLLKHVQNLENKISAAKFEMDQLVISQQAFYAHLTKALEEPEEKAA